MAARQARHCRCSGHRAAGKRTASANRQRSARAIPAAAAGAHLGQVVGEELGHLDLHLRLHAAQRLGLERLCRGGGAAGCGRSTGSCSPPNGAPWRGTRSWPKLTHARKEPCGASPSFPTQPLLAAAQPRAPSVGKTSGATRSSPARMPTRMSTMPGRKVRSASSVSSRMERRSAPSSSSPVSAREAEKSTMARSPRCSGDQGGGGGRAGGRRWQGVC